MYRQISLFLVLLGHTLFFGVSPTCWAKNGASDETIWEIDSHKMTRPPLHSTHLHSCSYLPNSNNLICQLQTHRYYSDIYIFQTYWEQEDFLNQQKHCEQPYIDTNDVKKYYFLLDHNHYFYETITHYYTQTIGYYLFTVRDLLNVANPYPNETFKAEEVFFYNIENQKMQSFGCQALRWLPTIDFDLCSINQSDLLENYLDCKSN